MALELDRNCVRIIKMSEDTDNGFVEASPAERIAMVWEITKDAWAFAGELDVEQRLQRHITKLTRRKR